MPRKGTASTSGPADVGAASATSSSHAPSNLDGDTSVMSVATETSLSSKPHKTSTKGDTDGTGIDDLLLPRTLTSRLARGTLPPNTSIQKDALLALTKAASVFISYLASHSNEVTTKKTIGPQDVLKAIQEIEMGGVMGLGEVGADGKVGGRLERELEVWETVVRGKRKGYREKVKQRESGVGPGSSENGDEEKKEGEDDRGEPEAKRARVEGEDGGKEEGRSGPQGARRVEGYTGATSFDGQQTAPPRPTASNHGQPLTNGAGKGQRAANARDDEGEDDDEDDDDGSVDGDETQADEDDDPEDEEEPAPDEEELDGYGPEDQLRHDMNGDETGDESE